MHPNCFRVADILRIPHKDLSLETPVSLDSLERIDLLYALEDEFDVDTIDAPDFRTVGEIVKFVS